jgi:hypothetical protein
MSNCMAMPISMSVVIGSVSKKRLPWSPSLHDFMGWGGVRPVDGPYGPLPPAGGTRQSTRARPLGERLAVLAPAEHVLAAAVAAARTQTVPACVRACAQYDDSAREINTTRAKHASFPQNTHHAQSVKAIQIRWPDMRLFGVACSSWVGSKVAMSGLTSDIWSPAPSAYH